MLLAAAGFPVFALLSAAAPARMPPAKLQIIDPDTNPTFASDELESAWERTGKGKARWKPGDKTGDSILDTRLMYSNWVLNPLTLTIKEPCVRCSSARFALGWLGLPFECKMHADDGSPHPRLEGPGLPEGGLQSPLEICSFAACVHRHPSRRLPPATGREDVARFLESKDVTQLPDMLHGRDREDLPSLNAWGFSMDDVSVLATLHAIAASDGVVQWPEEVREYMELACEKATVPMSWK